MTNITFKIINEYDEEEYSEHNIFLSEQGFIYMDNMLPENRLPEEYQKGKFLVMTIGAVEFTTPL